MRRNPPRLSIQEMMAAVLEETPADAMFKIAEAAEGEKDKDKKPVSKEEAERQADKEEAQQGGGQTQSASPEKTASERIQKMAAAVEEIVAAMTGQAPPSPVGRVVTAATEEAAKDVGPGKGPGATETNVDAPTSGEQSDVSGEAKTKIPLSPPMESKGSGGAANAPANAMATNAEMTHPPQPEEGVLKQASDLRSYAEGLLKEATLGTIGGITGAVRGARSSEKGEKYEGAMKGLTRGAAGGGLASVAGGTAGGAAGSLLGGLAGLAAKRPIKGALIGGGLGTLGGAVTGDILGGRAATKSMAPKKEKKEKEKKGGVLTFLGKNAPGSGREAARRAMANAAVAGQQGASGTARELEAEVAKRGKKVLLGGAAALTAAGGAGAGIPLALRAGKKEKKAEDAINKANISAPVAKGLPEDQPSEVKRPAEVTSQERLIASNEAPANAQKVDTQAVPKKRMGEVLSEPAQTASTDKVLDQALGASVVDQAGAKIASDQKVKVAAARAWLQKIASEGCTCGPETEVCNCQFGKLASRLKKGGQKGSEKRSMFGANGVPPSVQASSPAGSQAGGNTPQV